MSGDKIPGYRQRTRRPYLNLDGEGFNPHERGQYVAIVDDQGDVVGTGINCKEAWAEANETLQRRQRDQARRDGA